MNTSLPAEFDRICTDCNVRGSSSSCWCHGFFGRHRHVMFVFVRITSCCLFCLRRWVLRLSPSQPCPLVFANQLCMLSASWIMTVSQNFRLEMARIDSLYTADPTSCSVYRASQNLYAPDVGSDIPFPRTRYFHLVALFSWPSHLQGILRLPVPLANSS